jgi:phosphopentomutase
VENGYRTIMVQENGNGNGKTIEVKLGREAYKKVEEIADSKDLSVSQFARESLQHSVERHELHEVVKSACQDSTLSENSKVCRHIEKGGFHGEYSK